MAKKKNKGEEDEEEKKGRGGKLKIVVGVVAAAAIYKFLIAPSPEPESVDGEEAAVEEAAERVVEEGLILPLDEIVVNLADADANRYLRVGIALVLEEGVAVEAVEPESPRAIDAAIDYLSSQSFDTLRQPGSKTVVRNELSTLIREAFEDEMVMRVLLTTFVMQ